MKVVEIINQHLPVDAQAEYDHGTLLAFTISSATQFTVGRCPTFLSGPAKAEQMYCGVFP
ncbi:MAG: hypothetical protein R3C56_26190 [Pirellulaceae bacterium]